MKRQYGLRNVLRNVLETNVDPEGHEEYIYRLNIDLLNAIEEQNLQRIKMLLEHGANNYNTALAKAGSIGNIEMIKQILYYGGNVSSALVWGYVYPGVVNYVLNETTLEQNQLEDTLEDVIDNEDVINDENYWTILTLLYEHYMKYKDNFDSIDFFDDYFESE